MPVIEDYNLSNKTRYVLWEITENYEKLSSGIELDLNSEKLLYQKKSEIHKKQFLAVKNILKYLSIDERSLNYDDSGRLFLKSGSKISITHSGYYAGVIISDNEVGIDLEMINDKALKVKNKFLETELNYPIKLNTETALVYWNIKESIFKALEIQGIDFKKNILALPLDINTANCKSWYINNDDIYSFETYFRISKNYTLAFVIKN